MSNNIMSSKYLDIGYKWIFVGGRNESGKTTIAASIAVHLSKIKNRVLLISSDPTQSINAIFKHKFCDLPRHVPGSKTLWAMNSKLQKNPAFGEVEASALANIFTNIMSDEFEVVVFDMYSINNTINLFEVILTSNDHLQLSKIQPLLSLFDNFLFDTHQISELLKQTAKRIKNRKETAFIITLSPNYWPLLNSEDLYQYLIDQSIDLPFMIINQIYQREDCSCNKCLSVCFKQESFIKNIFDLYDTVKISKVPYVYDEISGLQALENLSFYLKQLFSQKT